MLKSRAQRYEEAELEEAKQLLQDRKHVERELKEKRSELASIESSLAPLKKEVASFNDQKKEVEKDVESLELRKGTLQDNLASLTTTINQLSQEVTDKRSSFQSLIHESEDIRKIVDRLKEDNKDLENKKSRLESEVTTLERTIYTLKDEASGFEDKRKKSEHEYQLLLKELREKEEAALSEHSKKMAEYNSFDFSRMRDERMKEIQRDIEAAEAKCLETEKEMTRQIDEKNEVYKQVQGLKGERYALESEMDTIKLNTFKEVNEMNDRIEISKKQLQHLEAKIAEAKLYEQR